MNGKIYKITNTITGEAYIGQTVNSLEERFRHHKQGTRQPKKYMTKLQKAMDLYGKPAFTIELIEDGIKTIDELCEKEKYYIKLYRTQNEYNSTVGGESKLSRKPKKKSMKKVNIEFISNLPSREQDLFMFIVRIITESKSNAIEIPFREIRAISNPRRWPDKEIKRTLENISSSSIEHFLQQEDLNLEIKILDKSFIVLFNCFDSIQNPVNLINFLEIKNRYSKVLYLIIVTQFVKNEATYTPDELVEIMNLPESYLLTPKKIKSQILIPSISEIKNLFIGLELEVNYSYGNRIESYTFKLN